jgi:hypothetical protein
MPNWRGGSTIGPTNRPFLHRQVLLHNVASVCTIHYTLDRFDLGEK